MAAISLKSLRDFIVLCYRTNAIDDLEFFLHYDYSQSREIFIYQKCNQFNLEIFDETPYVTELSSAK